MILHILSKKTIAITLSMFIIISSLFASFAETCFAADSVMLWGDADMNGKVDVKDATTIQKYLADLIGENDIDPRASMVTGRSYLSVVDATCIQRYVADIITSFPAESLGNIEDTKDTITLTFNVKISSPLKPGESIGIGTNLNNWKPDDESWRMDKVDELNYRLSVSVDNEKLGTTVEYKYTLQRSNLTNAWGDVECNTVSDNIPNRSFKITEGENSVNDKVLYFLSTRPATTLSGGTLETFTLEMPQYSDGRTRLIRVWLPDGYAESDTTKKYPVLYMHDGQNIFDAYTSFCGEWNVDEAISEMIREGYEGTVVVGIDNSSDRFNEYTPDWQGPDPAYSDNPSGDKYAEFIVDTLKPYIDSHYNVRTDKDSTTIGGSSMGGMISFYIGLKYPDIFGKALVFSPAYWVFGDEAVLSGISSFDYSTPDEMPMMYLYAGGAGDEAKYTRYIAMVKDKLLECGYPEQKLNTLTDITQTHNESAWSKYFPQAYRWLVGFE